MVRDRTVCNQSQPVTLYNPCATVTDVFNVREHNVKICADICFSKIQIQNFNIYNITEVIKLILKYLSLP